MNFYQPSRICKCCGGMNQILEMDLGDWSETVAHLWSSGNNGSSHTSIWNSLLLRPTYEPSSSNLFFLTTGDACPCACTHTDMSWQPTVAEIIGWRHGVANLEFLIPLKLNYAFFAFYFFFAYLWDSKKKKAIEKNKNYRELKLRVGACHENAIVKALPSKVVL